MIRYFTVWLPLAVVLAGVAAFVGGSPWPEAVALAIPLATVFAFLCLGAGYSCRVLPLSRTTAGRTVLSHLTTAIVTAALWVGLARVLGHLLEQADLFPGVVFRLSRMAGSLMALGILLYLLAVAVHYLATAREESRLADQRVLQADLAAREAELKALKAQIDPHFLFNSLNTINALIGTDPDGARQACAGLGDLMRLNLKLGHRPWVRMEEELALVRRYLEMEKIRLGTRLQVDEQVDPAGLAITVPPLILQPLVENAVKHGIAARVDGGTLTILARVDADRLLLEVTNPMDTEGEGPPGTGTGLQNLRRRLMAIYGNGARLHTGQDGSVYAARIDVPTGGGDD